MVSLGHIDLTADDGLDVGIFPRHLEELLDAIHEAMVRDGQGGHAQLVDPREKISYGRLSVQDGILGVDMEMYKTHICTKVVFLPRIDKKKREPGQTRFPLDFERPGRLPERSPSGYLASLKPTL